MNKLIWFRQDLRVHDNVTLTEACQQAREHGSKLYALYTASSAQWLLHDVAPIQVDFIERHLNALKLSLAKLNIELLLIHVDHYQDIPTSLADFCLEKQIDHVFASEDPEWNERLRDTQVEVELQQKRIELQIFEQHCIAPCMSVLNGSEKMYRVFTPFSRRWREQVNTRRVSCLPVPMPISCDSLVKIDQSELVLEAEKIDSRAWPVGEAAVLEHVKSFIDNPVHDYAKLRDFPAQLATSGLSPYLAIGAISPRQCLSILLSQFPEVLVEETSPARIWLNELIWREFYRHLLVAFPKLSRNQNFKDKADGIVWRNDPLEFEAWCNGMTGYPIVDAGMRQLNQTGWMHNRLRMIVASFLTKHLLIDWRWGEAYFKRHLIDGDLAANNGGWQWAAGTGCDAQPYFRIFNPMTQAKKFDPKGEFIRHFIPELVTEEGKDIFEPKTWNRICSQTQKTYPQGIVEHSFARLRALDKLSVMKAG